MAPKPKSNSDSSYYKKVQATLTKASQKENNMAMKPQPRPAKIGSKGNAKPMPKPAKVGGTSSAKPMPKPAKIKPIGKDPAKKSPAAAKAALDEKRRENYNAMRGTGKGMKNTLMRVGGMPSKTKKK